MVTIKEIYKTIETEAKTNSQKIRVLEIVKKDGESFLRWKTHEKMGKASRQGDINIHLVDAKHEHGPKLKTRQLALGSGKGASHIAGPGIDMFEGTTLPKWCGPRTFLGPCIQVKKTGIISHGLSDKDPERHAYYQLPAGTYQITHQMDPRTLERVAD